MKKPRWDGLTLSRRIVLFLVLSGAALLVQIVLWRYQSAHIFRPTQTRIGNIQAISQLLHETDACLTALEEQRWDYGDTLALSETLARYPAAATAQLRQLRTPPEASEEYRLLYNAVETSCAFFTDRIGEIRETLLSGEKTAAAQLYYNRTADCGAYLLQYTRELLEQAILDYHGEFSALYATSDRLQTLQMATELLSVVATVLLVVSLVFLLRSVMQLSRASQQISRGELDIPDVDESRKDEIGNLAGTFNEMKRSMKQQMQLMRDKSEMERELYTKETEALALQNLIEAGKLQLLRSQIHPHFLFNTLNVILYTARQEGAEKTAALIASLSRVFRYALGSNAAAVPLSKEKQIVDDIYSLYHARFENRLSLSWEIDPRLDLTETMIPSFLIQPLVENAIQHGIAPKEEGGAVRIRVRVEGDALEITVSDNGVGMPQEALDALSAQLQSGTPGGKHIGLYNVAARLRLSRRSPDLEITSEEGVGTNATMRLPLVLAGETEEPENE